MRLHIINTLLSFSILTCLSGCAGFNDLGNSSYDRRNDPYYDNNYGSYDNDDYHRRRERERYQDERRDLHRERERLEDERERLERERERQRHTPPPAPPQAQQLRCPSGYQESERKCSVEERRKGCKDMRLSNGLGCVRR